MTLSLLELLIAAKNKLELKLCLNLAKSVYICLFGHAVAQGVILPTGVRAFPAGNLEILQEILPENPALLQHFEFCG